MFDWWSGFISGFTTAIIGAFTGFILKIVWDIFQRRWEKENLIKVTLEALLNETTYNTQILTLNATDPSLLDEAFMRALNNSVLRFLPSEFTNFLSWVYMVIRDINEKIRIIQNIIGIIPPDMIPIMSGGRKIPIREYIKGMKEGLLPVLKHMQKRLKSLRDDSWKNYSSVLRDMPLERIEHSN